MMSVGIPAGIRALGLVAGCGVAGAAWLIAPALQPLDPNAAEAALNVGMACLAAPLLAASAAGSRVDPVARWPSGFSPLALAVLHWGVVWAWHAPAARLFAHEHPQIAWLRAVSILAVGVMLWLSVLGGREARYERVGAGIIALLTTSIHMTLLAGLSLIGRRPPGTGAISVSGAAYDQTLGGLVLLGGAVLVYVAAGGLLLAWLLHPKARIGRVGRGGREAPVTTAGCRS